VLIKYETFRKVIFDKQNKRMQAFILAIQQFYRHQQPAKHIAAMLNVSESAAYRRLQGETEFTANDIITIAAKLSLSLDETLLPQRAMANFKTALCQNTEKSFDEYIQLQYQQMQAAVQGQYTMSWLCKDVPILYYYHYQNLTAFKFYFWKKYIAGLPSLQKETFHFNSLSPQNYTLAKKIANAYSQIPTSEVYNSESIHTTLRQIQFSIQAGDFKRKRDAVLVLQEWEALFNLLELQAEHSEKFIPMPKGKYEATGVSFAMYLNEYILTDNSILFKNEATEMALINFGVLNFLTTGNPTIVNKLSHHIQVLHKNSTPLNSTNSKNRNNFFKKMHRKIEGVRNGLR
jgi:hypothetical protein